MPIVSRKIALLMLLAVPASLAAQQEKAAQADNPPTASRWRDLGPHPRLLIDHDDLARIRHLCGVGKPADAERGFGRFGAHGRVYQELRTYFSVRTGDAVLPGEPLAAAFCLLIAPAGDPATDDFTDVINDALKQPFGATTDPVALAVAVDWTFPHLAPEAVKDAQLELRKKIPPLDEPDSPLRHREFRRKLGALAFALAVDEQDDPSPSWAAYRRKTLEAAQQWSLTTLPRFLDRRGPIPTGPAHAAWEESDTALLLELSRPLLETQPWNKHAADINAWLAHYVLQDAAHPALRHQFLRDDAGKAPLTPAPELKDLLPLTAHLFATRTDNPLAALVAADVSADLRDPDADLLAMLWRWVDVAFPRDPELRAGAEREISDTTVDLQHAVICRRAAGPTSSIIWLDAAQPVLRAGQHFDAGNFLIHAGGHLVVEAGDDVALEAVPNKGGRQGLGRDDFDFAQWYAATIAHNCMIFHDPARVPRWYGDRFLPIGGQTPVDGTLEDFSRSLAATGRTTGKRLGFGTQSGATYLALDLATAYDQRSVSENTREFLLLGGHLLLVIDRARTAGSLVTPTAVVQLPQRPSVNDATLPAAARIRGATNDAGVWRFVEPDWIRWSDLDGAAALKAVWPPQARVAIVGGPAETMRVEHGRFAGRQYVGGSPHSYERLILPSGRGEPANAWYKLGHPTLLRPMVGRTPHWGRIEIEAPDPAHAYLFVTAVAFTPSGTLSPPSIAANEADGALHLDIRQRSKRWLLKLPGDQVGGTLTSGDKHWGLPANNADAGGD